MNLFQSASTMVAKAVSTLTGRGKDLPALPLTRAPARQVTTPSDRMQADPRSTAVVRYDRQLATTNRLTSQSLADTRRVVRELSKASPDLASSVSFMQRTGIPEKYTVIGRNMDGTISADATNLAQQLLRRMTVLPNADGSFKSNPGLQSLSEQLTMELQLYGGMCGEVALDMARVPAKIAPISLTTLVSYDEQDGFHLAQRVAGVDTPLDYPTIIYVTVDQLLTDTYASSYLESAIQPILADIDFNNDMRRFLKRSVIPRIQAIIDSDKVKKRCPPEIMMNPVEYQKYQQGLIDEIAAVLNNMNPEDAIVTFDTVTYEYLDSQQDPSAIVEKIQDVLNAKLSSGAKTLPVILGHSDASNASSTQAVLYVKQADMLRRKLNEFYTQALTVAVRIMGVDAYVEFCYEDINLRPVAELEAFAAMKQSRILMQLSLGLISDEEACVMLTGNLPPAGFKTLSGTGFLNAVAVSTQENPASNTSALEHASTPTTPKKPKS